LVTKKIKFVDENNILIMSFTSGVQIYRPVFLKVGDIGAAFRGAAEGSEKIFGTMADSKNGKKRALENC